MGKCSISPLTTLLLSLDVRDKYRRGHGTSLSIGDG
jgi:hypothetical protein